MAGRQAQKGPPSGCGRGEGTGRNGNPRPTMTKNRSSPPVTPGDDGDRNDSEFLQLKYGRQWRSHLVPSPDSMDEATGIGDLAPGAENDTPPERRAAQSTALVFRISSSCAGHAQPPTPTELHDAFHTETPTTRSRALLRMWMTEASANDVIDAWRDHCYTWRELTVACHRHGIRHAVNAPILNRMRQRADDRGPPE